MEIEFISQPIGDIVAWELQFGAREGRFIADADGSVSYWHPADRKFWHAGASLEEFRACAEAWNTYVAEAKHVPEHVQLAAVAKLRAFLEETAVLRVSRSFWSALLEQAEQGLL